MTCAGQSTVATGAGVPFRPGLLELAEGGVGRLVGSRCPACGARFFPPRHVCSRCLAEPLEPAALSTRGTVYTYTVVHQAAPGFETPYVLGYVDLPEGVRVLGQVAGIAPDEARIGMAVELAVEPFGEDEQGRLLIGYRFRPVPEEAGGE